MEDLCGSPHLPFQLATTLEDIGQGFVRLAEQINDRLKRRGLLDQGRSKRTGPSRRISERLLAGMRAGGETAPFTGVALRGSVLSPEAIREAFKLALIMTHDLPIPGAALTADLPGGSPP